jgi:ribonucleoside-diphosphate reductase alpha chain
MSGSTSSTSIDTRVASGDTIQLTDNARTVLTKRYLRKGSDGKPVETIEEMFHRIARAVAEPDVQFGHDLASTGQAFYNLLTGLRFMPNSPTFTGAGTPLGQLAACFVLPIADDMGRQFDGIFSTLRVAALIQQTGGGNGFSFSRLRPRGDVVVTSAGTATGPVGFLRVYDTAFGEIAQGGTRRGANMAVLRVDHPDILEFIRCKEKEGEIVNFNISVGITDAFMRAVEQDKMFDLVNPRDRKVWRTIRAREIFDEIVRHAHHNGEPGVLFLDTANRSNPVPHLYELEATNPCGEQWLGPYENCCLGSINLAKHIRPDGQLDWEKLRKSVELSTHFLDNVVTANKYVPTVPKLEEAALDCRRIGLGIMGLGDVMYSVGVRYGSPTGEELASQIIEFVRFHAIRTSIELAKERGSFPAIKGSIYDPQHLTWTPPQPLTSYSRDFGRPGLDWDEIVRDIQVHGIRNAAQTTIAPTGTIATVAGCESYGCEPVFALAYVRHMVDAEAGGHDGRTSLIYNSPLFEQVLIKAGLDKDTRQRIYRKVSVTGSCEDVPEVPEQIREVFVVANDITPEQHVRMQAAMQRFVDNSISKTCNFPATATTDDVARAYFQAWELGCKGLTIYVTGSREKVVLETRETMKTKEQARPAGPSEEATSVMAPAPRSRQPILEGKTYRMETPLGTAFITINNLDGDGQPYEVFVTVGKGGSDTAAMSEALGRLISLELQTPSPWTATERVKRIIDQLQGIGGRTSLGFGPNRVSSLPDAVATALSRHIGLVPAREINGNGQAATLDSSIKGDLCPRCGQATFVRMEGCQRCLNLECGYSEC